MSLPAAAETIRVRSLEHPDLPLVMALAQRVPAAPQWPDSVWRQMLENTGPSRCILVAAREQQIFGFCVVVHGVDEAELESIAVDPAMQRLGLGSRLLQAAMEASRHSGARRMLLEVRASNQPAQHLYAQAGFRTVGRRPGYYSDPKEDAICMECRLDAETVAGIPAR